MSYGAKRSIKLVIRIKHTVGSEVKQRIADFGLIMKHFITEIEFDTERKLS